MYYLLHQVQFLLEMDYTENYSQCKDLESRRNLPWLEVLQGDTELMIGRMDYRSSG